MVLDIPRLHDVIEGKLVGRGAGSTTALVIRAIQSADLLSFIGPTNSRFVVVSQNEIMSKTHLELAAEIAYGMRLFPVPVSSQRRLMFDKGLYLSQIMFVSRQELPRAIRGVRIANYFVGCDLQPELTREEIDLLESCIERE